MPEESPNDGPSPRTLRFSLFLQGFALLMMGGAFIVRAAVLGWDITTVFLGLLVIVIVGAMLWTISRLRSG